MKLVFATNNVHKIREVQHMMPAGIQLLTLNDIDAHDDLPETSSTFDGNALQKARYIYDKFGMDCFADDSGLEVDALNGIPGVHSARYAGTMKAVDNIQKLLLEMRDHENRRAQFRTVVASIIGDRQKVFEGILRGTITLEPRGAQGFGYDPVFVPDGKDITFAEMAPAEKNAMSHRALAMQKFSAYLAGLATKN